MLRLKDDSVQFNGTDLNTIEGIQITSIQPHRLQNRSVSNFVLAHTDGSATTSAFYGGRNVNIEAVIAQPSRNLLDASLGQLRRILQPINKSLIIPIESEYRKLERATMVNFVVANIKGGYCELDIEFVTEDPFSYGLITTELLNALNLTSGNRIYPVTFEGTAKQAPIITITIDSLTLTESGSISIINPTTERQITITEAFNATDVVVIDCLNKTVTLNGEPHNFEGNFLTFESTDTYLRYQDDFTARQVDINVIYTKRYL